MAMLSLLVGITAAGCANCGATVFFDRPRPPRERYFQEKNTVSTIVALDLQRWSAAVMERAARNGRRVSPEMTQLQGSGG
jgi:hypothetical protein